MYNGETIQLGQDHKLGNLQAILYLLQTNLEGMKDEVDRSYSLFTQIGEKTDLSKKIEETLNNPIGSIFQSSSNVDSQVKGILDIIVKSFFCDRSDVIKSAFRSKTSLNDLHYSIVLVDDNIENRNKIFEFFDKFDLLEISSRYPVYFQFVPLELIDKINYVEEVIFSKEKDERVS